MVSILPLVFIAVGVAVIAASVWYIRRLSRGLEAVSEDEDEVTDDVEDATAEATDAPPDDADDERADKPLSERLRDSAHRLGRGIVAGARAAGRRLRPLAERLAGLAYVALAALWRHLRRLGRRLLALPPVTKALAGLALGLATITGAGLLYALTANVSTSASSAPIITFVLDWATNGWGYVLAALIFGRGTVWGIRKQLVRNATRETDYSPRVIQRLADEVQTTDGCSRAIIFGDDCVEEAAGRIQRAFHGKHDRIKQAAGPADTDEESDDNLSAANLPMPHPDPDVDDEDDLTPAERFKLFRMDLASGFRMETFIWRFCVPVAVVFVIELILVRFWVAAWLYPVLLSGALLVGLGVYQLSKWRRRRRLQALRRERETPPMDEVSVPVKVVDTDEITVGMGWVSGHTYASTDLDDLAETLAERALQSAAGEQPAPAIEERYAWCIERYILDFDGWRENHEKPAIMDALVNECLDSREGMLPKEVLAYRVVEHDRRYIWRGLRFVGLGYDPDLVAEAYAELVPNTLVERTVSVESTASDHDEMTVVRARTESLPPDVARIRASMSERFGTHQLPDRYALPDPDRDEVIEGFELSNHATSTEATA